MKHEAQAFVSSELTDKELEKIQHCCLPVFARFVEINQDTILSVYHFYCNLICLSFFLILRCLITKRVTIPRTQMDTINCDQ